MSVPENALNSNTTLDKVEEAANTIQEIAPAAEAIGEIVAPQQTEAVKVAIPFIESIFNAIMALIHHLHPEPEKVDAEAIKAAITK